MKFKILSMLVSLAILSVMPMIYMGKFDPLSFIDARIKTAGSDFDRLKAGVPAGIGHAGSDEKVQVYKWRDENGVMQFSNTPPAAGGQAERLLLNPDSNVVQAVKMPEKEPAAEAAESASPSPYSINAMQKAVNDAKAVEVLLQQRHESQQKMLDKL